MERSRYVTRTISMYRNIWGGVRWDLEFAPGELKLWWIISPPAECESIDLLLAGHGGVQSDALMRVLSL